MDNEQEVEIFDEPPSVNKKEENKDRQRVEISEDQEKRVEISKSDIVTKKEEQIEIIDIDEFLIRSNECGRCQIWIVVQMMLVTFTLAYTPFIFYFIGFDPHWIRSETDNVHLREDNARCFLNETQWRYDYEKTTVVTEYGLVCSKSWILSLLGSVVFVGWAFGSIVLGFFSDRYGRKIVMLPCLFLDLLCLFLHGFVTSLWLLIGIRFLMGFFHASPAINSYILIVELIGPNFRVLAANVAGVVWAIATAILALKAYLIDDWRTLCIAASAPYFILVLIGAWLPESVRWLNANGRTEEAEKILHKVAKCNKRKVENVSLKNDEVRHNYSYFDLFKSTAVLKITLSQGYIWVCLGMVYYTLSWAFADLGGDMYLNFILASLVELPMHAVCIVCLQSYGRKRTVMVSLFLTIIFQIVIIVLIVVQYDMEVLKLVFGLLSKSTIALAFMAAYMWSSEIFPTVVRTQGLAFNIVTSRLGAAISPFINNLDLIYPTLPFMVIVIATTVALFLCVFLPETLGKPTRERFEDIFNDD